MFAHGGLFKTKGVAQNFLAAAINTPVSVGVDQEQTRRVTEKKQPGACLQCHASNLPLCTASSARGTSRRGSRWSTPCPPKAHGHEGRQRAWPLVQHPVACVDCHDPTTMAPRVTRPAFIAGIRALKAQQGVADYDPNRDATRQEMRSFVCGQCHVEYYFKGAGKMVTYPWAQRPEGRADRGVLRQRQGFTDWKHAETGAKMLKAQHPEFEMWNQGIHARSGVACADCHMPYQREGAAQGQRPPGAKPAAEHHAGPARPATAYRRTRLRGPCRDPGPHDALIQRARRRRRT